MAENKKRLNEYVGYVVRTLVYNSQAWSPNRTQQKELKLVQKKATK